MTTKQSALEKLESMQTPEPKRRRTAQEQALAPLLKERAKVAAKLVDAQEAERQLGMQLLTGEALLLDKREQVGPRPLNPKGKA